MRKGQSLPVCPSQSGIAQAEVITARIESIQVLQRFVVQEPSRQFSSIRAW